VLSVGTAFSIDLSDFFTDPGSPTSELGFYDVSGQSARAAGWSISGTTLSNSNGLATSGVFQLVAVRNGISVLSSPISFAINATATTDTIAPTVPTGVVATQGSVANTITLSFDQPCDIAPNGAAASGVAHVDVLVNSTVSAPSPIATAANSMPFPGNTNIGNATIQPTILQNAKQWLMTAGGSGIIATTAEQILASPFGQYTGAQTFIAKLDAYGAAGALNALSGICIHETNVSGGRFVAVALRPLGSGTPGLVIVTRATPGAASVQQSVTALDINGQTITAAYVRLSRSSNLSSVLVSYSLDQSQWIDISTQTVAMASSVFYNLMLTSAAAGVAVTSSVEEVAITSAPRLTTTISSSVQVALQLRAVDNAGNTSGLSTSIVGIPKPPVTVPPGSPRIHPGHRFWLDNQFWPGNQSAALNAVLPIVSNLTNKFNGVGVLFTWANVSDPALTNGKQTFNLFRSNLTDILGRLRAITTKKIYLTVKMFTQAFYQTSSGTTTSVSGNTFTDTTAAFGTGWTQCNIGGHTHTVVSSTATTVTLADAVGAGAGASYLLGKAKVNDTSFWPAWLVAKSPVWVDAFFQTNTNSRGQLDYDNVAVWTAMTEMFQGMAQIINELDTDNRIDIVATMDESIAASSDINNVGIINAANYNTKFTQLHLDVKAAFPTRTIWCPLSYLPGTEVPAQISTLQTLQAAYPTGFGYGGPDTPLFGVHGDPTEWFTTFLDIITGITGTLGDVRDNYLRIGNTEGPGLGAGTGQNCPPALGTAQNIFNDVMTRQNIAATGGRSAHSGMGCSVMHWVYATRFCLQYTDEITVVNANNGSFTPLPPGSWDTSA